MAEIDVRKIDLNLLTIFDAIVAELKPKLETAGVEFMGPKDQTYNQREFMIRAPDGNVFVFGQGIKRG